MKGVREETTKEEIEVKVEVEAGDVRAFYSIKGVEAFKKHLVNKGFVDERAFKNLVPPSRRKLKKGAEK